MTDSSAAVVPLKRKYLVIADRAPEARLALIYAAHRAKAAGGRLTLLCVIEPGDFQHWLGVGQVMRAEAQDEAEKLLHDFSTLAHKETGLTAELLTVEGKTREEIRNIITNDPAIRVLVLGAATSKDGPGPLVESLVSDVTYFGIPVTVIPGSLAEEDVREAV